MYRDTLSRIPVAAGLILVAFLSACTDHAVPTAGGFPEAPAFSAKPQKSHGEALKVMTRNMYLGGDVNLVFGAAMSGNPQAIAMAAQTVWNQIQATNFPERAQALAQEIAENQPHVVGIQEIPLFEVMASPVGPVIQAQDNAEILMMALAGEPYEMVAIQENTQAVFPIVIDEQLLYIRFTDRIAMLVRDGLEIGGVASATFGAAVPLIPGQLELERGWIRLSTHFSGLPYHIVTTHLEVQSFQEVQDFQVQELLYGVMADLNGITILMGDLNSDAENGPPAPSYTPTYENLLAAGFQDAWEIANPGRPKIGFSCCQVPLLNNPMSVLDERIDFVLLRTDDRNGGAHRIPGSIHVDLVGADPSDRTSSGLWPADHAGLVASLRVPTGIFRNP